MTTPMTLNSKSKGASARWGQEAISLLVIVFFVMPLVWMLLAAFKPQTEVFLGKLLPSRWEWGNLKLAWESAPFGRYLLNSLLISLITTAAVVTTSALAAYAFARMTFPLKGLLFALALGTLMIPGDVLLIPNFMTVRQFGWLNSYQALIVPFAASAFGVFLLRQAFLQTPVELEEAARLDGATPAQYLRMILLPVNTPVLSALSILTFLSSWNALVWPLVVTNRDEFRTVQVGLASFSSLEGSNLPLVMAATVIVVTPMLLFYIFAQKWFIESAAASGLKG
ncbi:carbohydrate ABC transporter permease [Deinococcus sp.]|uniref:carbohydrate ABC transporter permease n=1 Tax=Deinococcus sp. TaxID=47478 RepID=UPI0025BBB580|nr:carbohydrate ABC transporter permease [Deinococcus sp.]